MLTAVFYFEYKINPVTGIANSIKLYGRLYQADKVYYGETDKSSLRRLMKNIGEFLSTNVTFPTRATGSSGYEVRTASTTSLVNLIEY